MTFLECKNILQLMLIKVWVNLLKNNFNKIIDTVFRAPSHLNPINQKASDRWCPPSYDIVCVLLLFYWPPNHSQYLYNPDSHGQFVPGEDAAI